MKVIICGAGQVGWQIARHLSGENNDVTVVDNNPALVRRATDTLDVQGLTGFASHPDVLDTAGARDADMVIAATFSDEVNMVTCQVAHSVFSVPRKIARLRSQSYLDAIYSDLYRRDHLPIDVVISPEKEVAEAALRRISSPSTFDNETFLSDDAQMLGIALGPDCPVLNTPLKQLSELFLDPQRHRRRRAAGGHAVRSGPGRPAVRRGPDLRLHPLDGCRSHAGDLRQDGEDARARDRDRRRQCGFERGAHAGRPTTAHPNPRDRGQPQPGGGRGGRAGTDHRAAWRRARHGAVCARRGWNAPMPSCA
jgi:Trk K+ transport system NAD-binding subunit